VAISAEGDRADVAAVVVELDKCLRRPVLVFGSLPPAGRDLDLLARWSEAEALAIGLASLGFESKGHQWARFRNGEADVVEVVPTAAWQLPPEEVGALFETGAPLPGTRAFLRPAPPHAALILARKFVRARARQLDRKTREQIESLTAEDPDVWERAAERAHEWGAQAALRCLWRAYSERSTVSRAARVRAVKEVLIASGRGPVRAHLRAWASLLPRPRRGALVTLSGLDGAGKSSQAAALHRALDTLGYRPVREWAPLGGTRSAMAVVSLGRPLLRRAMGSADRTPRLGIGQANGDEPRGKGRSEALRAVWVTILVSLNAAAHVRAKLRHAGKGRTMIFDRYVLDSAVQLQHNYGDTGLVRLCIRLLKVLSPKATRAYLLDVSPETARGRKEDLWSTTQLGDRARLYRDWHQRFGVVRLDGERPPEVLADEIARDVWRSLGKSR
jgi:thymidylate kinase